MKMTLDSFTKDLSFPFFIQYGFHEKDMYLHSHDNYSELVIVLDGSADHIVCDDKQRIRKGDVFVISNDIEHGYQNAEFFRICNIMFDPRFFFENAEDLSKSAGFQALFVLEPHYTKERSFKNRLRLGIDDFMQICKVIEKIYEEYYLRNECRKTVITCDFLRLCAMLSRLYSFDSLGADENMINLAKAVTYIEQNFGKKIKIPYLATLSGCSDRQFIRVFKNAFNCTPSDYIMNIRVKNSKRLLRLSNYTITEIAYRCGFGESNYFTRAFKQAVGVTPSEFRADKFLNE
ncbi:MAG: AraC family transcriptional regulator [Ruminococcus sp.]|nr:AraC family transcriptional regulator [Ruminococcus sp.]